MPAHASNRLLAAFLALAGAGSAAAGHEPPSRWLPERCLELAAREAELASAQAGAHDPGSPAGRWNRHYRAGFTAIEQGDLAAAEREMCLALAAARAFAADDWRFAETLDELGLVYHSLGDLDAAERMQGAAVAEILLVRGPTEPGAEPTSCREPSVDLFLGRLGFVLAALGREALARDLEAAPHRVLALGYLPIDAGLKVRVEGLISQYLKCEDLDAADDLTAWLARRGEQD